jgi:hypothetical protein
VRGRAFEGRASHVRVLSSHVCAAAPCGIADYAGDKIRTEICHTWQAVGVATRTTHAAKIKIDRHVLHFSIRAVSTSARIFKRPCTTANKMYDQLRGVLCFFPFRLSFVRTAFSRVLWRSRVSPTAVGTVTRVQSMHVPGYGRANLAKL